MNKPLVFIAIFLFSILPVSAIDPCQITCSPGTRTQIFSNWTLNVPSFDNKAIASQACWFTMTGGAGCSFTNCYMVWTINNSGTMVKIPYGSDTLGAKCINSTCNMPMASVTNNTNYIMFFQTQNPSTFVTSCSISNSADTRAVAAGNTTWTNRAWQTTFVRPTSGGSTYNFSHGTTVNVSVNFTKPNVTGPIEYTLYINNTKNTSTVTDKNYTALLTFDYYGEWILGTKINTTRHSEWWTTDGNVTITRHFYPHIVGNYPLNNSNITEEYQVEFNITNDDNKTFDNISLYVNGTLNTTQTSNYSTVYYDFGYGNSTWFGEICHQNECQRTGIYNFAYDHLEPHFCRLDGRPVLTNYSNTNPNYMNYTVAYEVCNGEFNVTDWRRNNLSMFYNYPLDLYVNWEKDYSLFNTNFTRGTYDPAQIRSDTCLKGGCLDYTASNPGNIVYGKIDSITLNDDDNSYTRSRGFAYSVWVKPTEDREQAFIEHDNIWIGMNTDGTALTYTGTYGSYGFTGTMPHLQLNSWNHIIVVRNESNSKFELYVNGTYIGKSDDGQSSETGIVYVGKDTVNFPQFSRFSGYIDELTIWNETMTDKMIKEIYEIGRRNLSMQTYVIKASELTCSERWLAAITPSNGIEDGDVAYSNELTYECERAIATLVRPENNSAVTTNALQFNWSANYSGINNCSAFINESRQSLEYNDDCMNKQVTYTLPILGDGIYNWTVETCRWGLCTNASNYYFNYILPPTPSPTTKAMKENTSLLENNDQFFPIICGGFILTFAFLLFKKKKT